MPLVAVGATAETLRTVTGGLPAGAVEVDAANVVMAATPCEPIIFRDAIVRHAREPRRDVLLARTGLWPEMLSPVTAEVALTVDREVVTIADLVFFRHLDGTLWLVPSRTGPFVAITPNGLGLEMTAPVPDMERTLGMRMSGGGGNRQAGPSRAVALIMVATKSRRRNQPATPTVAQDARATSPIANWSSRGL